MNAECDLHGRLMAGVPAQDDRPEAVAELLSSLTSEWKASAGEVYMTGGGKAPDWLEFEFRAWELGEALRQVMKKKSGWKKNQELLDAISRVARDSELKRGREPFVELLGRFAAEDNRDLLLVLIDEVAIAGHAIKALRLGRVPGASAKIKALLKTEKRGWVKREAKKYLALWA